jgi:hypothetical protein
VILSEREDFILVGELENLLKAPKESSPSSAEPTAKLPSAPDSVQEDVPMSIIVISNVDTICQILKMSIRDLPDPLIAPIPYKQLIDLVKKFEQVSFFVAT